jgi:hypothetical protein
MNVKLVGRCWGRSWSALPIVLAAIAVFTAGCGQKAKPVDQKQMNLSWLGSMYRTYISQNQGHPPKTIDDFRKYVEKNTGPEQLARLNVSTINDLFISPGDGKPFALVSYDKLPAREPGSIPPIVIYESQGAGGTRAVAFLGGNTRLLDESEFQKLLPSNAKVVH